MKTKSGKKPKVTYIPQIPDLDCQELIGSGHFSCVFKGSYKGRSPVSIKIIDSDHDKEILKEIYILTKIKGCPHTINIIDALKIDKSTNTIIHRYIQSDGTHSISQLDTIMKDEDDDSDGGDSESYSEKNQHATILIIDFIEAISTHHFYHHIKLKYFKRILHDIFESLSSVHSRNIIHRDITENNILITPGFKHGYLIDWGCSGEIIPKKPLRPNSGSRQFRSPEMLFGYRFYNTKSDIWSIGVYILSVLCYNTVPWRAKTPKEVLIMMSEFFGSKSFVKLASDLNISLSAVFGKDFIEKTNEDPAAPLESCFSKKVTCLQHPLLISLLKDLLKVDPNERPTAEMVLNHPFFKHK